MTKKAYTEIPVTIGGKAFTMCFPYSALAKFCDKLKIPANDLQARLAPDAIMLSDLPALLWAGLSKKHPDLTPEDVDDMVDEVPPGEIKDIFAKVQDGLSAAFADQARVRADQAAADDGGNA